MDFHPRMLAHQYVPQPVKSAPRHFHPGMLGRQTLAGLGSVAPTIEQSIQFDAAQGTITVGGSTIKLVPAIISALAVKLIFFGGSKAALGAKALHRKLRGTAAPEAATNPVKRSERPWQAKRFNPLTGKKIATKRHKTQAAALRWAAEHGGPGKASYVG